MTETQTFPGGGGGPFDRVLDRLENVRPENGGFKASCPVPGHGQGRGDQRPSLSISKGDDGRVLLKCFAGCEYGEIVAALGLSTGDLFEKPVRNDRKANGHRRRIVAVYDYTNEDGKLLFQSIRYKPKGFSQRKPDDKGGWIYKDVFKNGTHPVLYRLPKVLEAIREGRSIWDVEGEEDVHQLEREGLTATTNPMGAGKFRDYFSDSLIGAHVRIIVDNDDPGRAHARDVARKVQGKAASVKIVKLPGIPEGGDVSDWFAAGGTVEELEKLVSQTPEYTPPEVRHPVMGRIGHLSPEIEEHMAARLDEMDPEEREDAYRRLARFEPLFTRELAGLPTAQPTPEQPPRSAGDSPPPGTNRSGGASVSDSFNLTDLGNAERLVARHGEDLRYVHALNAWLPWTDKRWQIDDTGEINRRAKDTVRATYGEAEAATDSSVRRELAGHAMKSEAESRLRAMISLAQSEDGIPVRPEDLDADPWLLNVENGTLDLKTGELREHRREDLITKLAPVEYDPDAKCPTWDEFLERILPSEALRQFVQRLCGYSLTGDVSAQVLPFFYGAGANGKSTLINTVLTVLGDYGQQAAPELLLSKRGAHPTELADLKGARLVASVEVEDGRRMAESLVKQLTGGERVKARYLHKDFFEFAPTHKLLLAANHKPQVEGTDHAIWRRVKLIPFEVTIPKAEQDPHLSDKLQAELPGILAWAVRGCLDWQRDGLGEPDEVKNATEEYRAEMDVLADFMRESCVIRDGVWCVFADLYESYDTWCMESGEKAESKRKFGARLKERGFPSANGTNNVAIRKGIALRDDRKPDGSGPPGINEHTSEKPPREGSKATGGNGINERTQNINSKNPCKTQGNGEAINHHYPENENSGSNSLTREVSEKSLMTVNSLIPKPSPKRKAQIDKLVSEGMSHELARTEVLGGDDDKGVV